LKRIAITYGDINGIGPEIIRKALTVKEFPEVNFSVFGPADLIGDYLKECPADIIDCPVAGLKIESGKLSPLAGEAAFLAVKNAVQNTIGGEFDALVTAPISKKAVNLARHDYSGHTEMLKEWCGVDDVLMMFLAERFKVGLLTVHTALADVPRLLTAKLIESKIAIMNNELVIRFGIPSPRIALCALNPHAGEDGMFGTEELEIMIPAAEKMRQKGTDVTNPLPADTLFVRSDEYDAIMAVYHDQGLIPAKMSPGGSTNYTGGLPIIRTSPDHGTAFDIAGKNMADPSGMINAIKWAVKLCQ